MGIRAQSAHGHKDTKEVTSSLKNGCISGKIPKRPLTLHPVHNYKSTRADKLGPEHHGAPYAGGSLHTVLPAGCCSVHCVLCAAAAVCCVQCATVCCVQRLMRSGSRSLGEPQRTPPPCCCCCLLLGVAPRLNRSQPPSSAQCCLRAATNSLSTYLGLPFYLHSTSLSDQANTRASTCVLYKCNPTPGREKAAAEIQLVLL